MANVFVYADETGDLDLSGKAGSSRYFGFGTAIFRSDHSAENWEAHILRVSMEDRGVNLPRGFHAKDDSWPTRGEVFALIGQQDVRVDTTFLLKENAYENVRAQGEMRLYKLAWFLHFKYLCTNVIQPADHIYVIVAQFGVKKRAAMARAALNDVAIQQTQQITMCIWEAGSAWGLQLADYALWGQHRELLGTPPTAFTDTVKPLIKSMYTPWGREN